MANEKIPKIIHYCWFGGNAKPEIIEKCIESWKRFCPSWEIVEWNENNYDVNTYRYVKEAYGAKKWAFVSDVVRLDVVYKYGGVYLDTDVELFANIDSLLENDAFFVFETDRNINTGIGFGANKENIVVFEMLKYYFDKSFIVKNKFDMSPCPSKNTEALIAAMPALKRNGKNQCVDGIALLSGATYNSFAHHHSTGLWGEGMSAPEEKFVFKDTRLKRRLRNPDYFDWIEDNFGKRAGSVYTFFVYDFLDLGLLYYVKRLVKRLIR